MNIGPLGLPWGSLHLFITQHPPSEVNIQLTMQQGSLCTTFGRNAVEDEIHDDQMQYV